MEMRLVVLFLVVSVSLTEAAGCIPTTKPQCYKKSTNPDDDFYCEWDDPNPKENQTYTLYIWDSGKKSVLYMNTGNQSKKFIPLEELGVISSKTDIWVQTQVRNLTCNSSKISVILNCSVKYSKPNIASMERSAGNLFLSLDEPKDNKSVIYEIRWRERGSEWQNATFETKENTYKDLYTLHLHNRTVYQIQLRRQAKLHSLQCNDSHSLWSDWSALTDIPLEIHIPPVLHLDEKVWSNGTRDIKITWAATSAEETIGGVTYNMNLSVWSCGKPKRIQLSTLNQTFDISVTYSNASISIIATNKVGRSAPKKIIIPPVKHRNECVTFTNITKAKKRCLEWYKMEDGEILPNSVKKSKDKLIKHIKNEVQKFVRHYYILHIFSKQHQTAEMCPFYSIEGAPIKGPGGVNTTDLTHESVVLNWRHIPMAEQRGFLKHYIIWISGHGKTKLHKVPADKTSFLIKNLHPGTSYTISIAGKTIAGKGPNTTVNTETHSKEKGLSWQDQTILSVCVVAFLCTFICSFAARRFKRKLCPVVPSPVVDAAEFIYPQDQDLSQITEEVHEFVLLLRQELNKSTENVAPGQSTILQNFGLVVFEEEEEEGEEGEVTDLSFMKSCFYPNPSYRGKTLQLPENFHLTDSPIKDNDTESTYRNGLFFETKVQECDKTSL
ncbi:interleukin-6 receptor subunit beta isoform X2 [Danio rerio]|uniref:Interleukin-6 receptor subunit beta isoform X2 n=2 Tax=Danio rerio TaxID=7955 RepID=A0AC58GSF4_DANRE